MTNWLKKIAYNPEIGSLNRYLQGGFDPWDYLYEIADFLKSTNKIEELFIVDPDEIDNYELGEQWIATATEQDLARIRKLG